MQVVVELVHFRNKHVGFLPDPLLTCYARAPPVVM